MVDVAAAGEDADRQPATLGLTPAGTITSCDAAAAELYGFPAEQLVGLAADLLVPVALRAEEAALRRRITEGGDAATYRTNRLRRDGTVVPVSMTVSPVRDATGAVTGIAAAARRAGDSRGSADRLQAQLSQQRTDVRDADDRFQAGLGADRARERLAVESSHRQFQAAMDDERAKERVQVHEAEDRFQLRMEAVQARERAHVQDAEDRYQLGLQGDRARERAEVEDAEDRFQVRMDVERAGAQRDRARLEAQLHQGERLKILGQLAGGVAHDFNNLLAVILNYAAFVTDELGTGPGLDVAAATRDVAQIRRAAERAAELTHQLLAFARREVVRPRVLDLNTVVADVEELLRRTIGEDVLLRTGLAPHLWPVLMDPGQVEQVLMNVAVNARDAMAGGGTLHIGTANVGAPDDRCVRLRISDTGTGMSAEVLDRVFEPFFTTKSEGLGTGLGLATVYGIVTQAGASIAIRSEPGVGTTLTILIPVTEEQAEPAAAAPGPDRRGNGETVLVVEDEGALRAVTERILAAGGYDVLAAADGIEAVALAAAHDGRIDLLVTDVVMPRMVGTEVAERIRGSRPALKVLYMSGYAQQSLDLDGSLDPDVHLIEKPFTAQVLLAEAGRILDPAGGAAPDPAEDRT